MRKIKLFEGNNINVVYKEILNTIETEGQPLTFGDASEIKKAKEITSIIHLYGQAIKDILDGKTPKGFSWSGKKILEYRNQFITDFKNGSPFEYTYPDLCKKYPVEKNLTFNQMLAAKENLTYDMKHNIQGNRNVGILYHPYFNQNKNMPCFNWFKVRYEGSQKVSMEMIFRSHDYGSAVWANLCAILYMFNYYIVTPNLCKLDEIILYSSSAHIYDHMEV